MKILSVVGARPQFIKAAPVSKILRESHEEILVHTGQHYDFEMSKIFFEGLNLPSVDHNLGVGSGTHGEQTGKMIPALEKVMLKEQPDVVLVYGDTNSTLAGALGAAKLHLPVAHVEAGLRSFNRRMPEEINRVVTDHVSDLLFCPTETAVENLKNEGIANGVYLTGDVMLDALLMNLDIAEEKSSILEDLGLNGRTYLLVTIHRPSNTDRRENLNSIVDALLELGETIVVPLHPRTRKALQKFGLYPLLENSKQVVLTEPLGYLDFLKLVRHAKSILTDSGGVQKEAYYLKKPCFTLREETEWVETLENNWNVLVGADKGRIISTARSHSPEGEQQSPFGDGHASECILHALEWFIATSTC